MSVRRYEATVIEADSVEEMAHAEADLVAEGGAITLMWTSVGMRAYRVERP